MWRNFSTWQSVKWKNFSTWQIFLHMSHMWTMWQIWGMSLTHSLTEDFTNWHDMTKKIDKDKYKDKDNDKDKDILRTPPKSNPRDLWPLRHLIRVMRRHDLTKKKTKTKTKTKTMTNTFKRHLQMTILERLWNCWHVWQLRTPEH